MLKRIPELAIALLSISVVSYSCVNSTKATTENQSSSESTTDGTTQATTPARTETYDELANEENYEQFSRSEYNTDLPDVPNIERPAKSSIAHFPFSKKKLFRSWVGNPSPQTPHCTFVISKESFYIADYDGDGAMPYEISHDSLTVYFNDFIKRGRIIEVGKDKLVIHWEGAHNPTRYYEWKN